MPRSALIATFGLCAALIGGAIFLSRGDAPTPHSKATPRPGHPRVLKASDPAVKAGLEEIERLRRMRAQRVIPMGGVGDVDYEEALQRLRQSCSPLLNCLEEAALDRHDCRELRVDLINLVAQHPGEETRTFLAALVLDFPDDEAVRIAALEHLMKYRDTPTFEVLRVAWQNPAPFEGRYHLCRAFGENGQPGAVPILREALATDRPPSVRCHAATALGAFASDESVREELRRLSQEDPLPAVRQNALQALKRGKTL